MTIGIPVLYLSLKNAANFVKKLWQVFIGKMSLIGIYPVDGLKPAIGKKGIMGLAHISNPDLLSKEAISQLNRYYLRHQSLSLDIDIFLKYLFRKKSGK